jgi:hypothetical protein
MTEEIPEYLWRESARETKMMAKRREKIEMDGRRGKNVL